MYFALSEDQKLFAATVKNLLSETATPDRLRNAWSDDLVHPDPLWASLAEMGVLGLTCPEAFGGLDLGATEWVVVLEEAGRVALPDPLLESMVVGTGLLAACGADPLKASWLPKLARGEATLGVAFEGQAFVASADRADLLLAQDRDRLYALEPADFECTRLDAVDGARRLFELSWKPETQEPIAEGHAVLAAITEAQDRGSLAAAAQLVGLSQHMLDMTIEYAKTRTQFGSAIGSFQAIKHKLADAWLALEFSRPVVYRAAHSVDHQRKDRRVHVAMAKAYASELGRLASTTALQCHGAIGYSQEYDLHLWMKRAWALASSWGDAAHHRRFIAESILDQTHYTEDEL
jgi:alkylation response protein AidB-like acyl-CoA dehydrogenase